MLDAMKVQANGQMDKVVDVVQKRTSPGKKKVSCKESQRMKKHVEHMKTTSNERVMSSNKNVATHRDKDVCSWV
ncbi:hypothetical protein AMTR_s00047p00220210 [Amborella trichopoda]|uniref:Uncharacterized protein n=1 Tax=Amborella trichopoda TaxID=13333 RepID=U5DBV0_AMBTC|nr:hypothetical protein AMTR_s00047p00220210 [Amborella trichopoda]